MHFQKMSMQVSWSSCEGNLALYFSFPIYILSVGHPTRYYLPTVCILGMHVLVATSCLILRNFLILCSHAPHCCCLRPAYGYE